MAYVQSKRQLIEAGSPILQGGEEVTLRKLLVNVVTYVGMVGCRAFDVAALNNFGYPAAKGQVREEKLSNCFRLGVMDKGETNKQLEARLDSLQMLIGSIIA